MNRPTIDAESFRKFVVYRQFLVGDNEGYLISNSDFESIKARDGKFWNKLDIGQKIFLTGFVTGYIRGS